MKTADLIHNPLTWVILVSAAWRSVLLRSVPLILTPDGLSHLSAAFSLFPISHDVWFQAWITPGYALFLRAVLAIAGSRPVAIITAQSALGLLSDGLLQARRAVRRPRRGGRRRSVRRSSPRHPGF